MSVEFFWRMIFLNSLSHTFPLVELFPTFLSSIYVKFFWLFCILFFFSNKSKIFSCACVLPSFHHSFFHSKIFRLFFLFFVFFPDSNRSLYTLSHSTFFSNAKLGDFCSKSRRHFMDSLTPIKCEPFKIEKKISILHTQNSFLGKIVKIPPKRGNFLY